MGFKKIGKKIQKAREEKGMTQVDLAKAIGITQAALSNYELGKRRLYLHQIEQIALLLGRQLDFFISDDRSETDPISPGRDSDQLLSRIKRLSDKDFSALTEFLNFLEWRKNHVPNK